MASEKLSGEGRFRWEQKHRRALHLLRTQFQLDSDDEVKIFSQVFGTKAMSKGKLMSQYGESIREGKEHQWRFLQDFSSTERQECRSMKERLTQAMIELDVEELSDVRLGHLSLSTPKRTKRSRSLPQLRALSEETFGPSEESRKKQRRALPVTSDDDERDPAGQTSHDFQEPDQAQGPINAQHIPRPKTPRTPRKELATIVYNRPCGPLMLTPQEYERTKHDLKWPNVEPPRPALLFRYWVPCAGSHEPSCVEITGTFVSRRFRMTFGIIDPGMPPNKNQPGSFWNDLQVHINGDKVDTPFVSLSNSLAWTLREAIKKTENGSKEVNISLVAVDSSMTLYYPPMFHAQLKNKFNYTKGAWNYQGTNEFLVYHSCKPFFTLSVSKIISWSVANPAAGQGLLRLEDLTQKACYHTKVLSKLKGDKIDFTPELGRSIAEMAMSLFEFSHTTPIPLVTDFIQGICEGWGLIPPRKMSIEQLNDIAANFAHAIVRKSPKAVDIGLQSMLKSAFSTGVKFGLADRTAAHKKERFIQMEKRSEALGLSSYTDFLAEEHDSAKAQLWAHADAQNKIIQMGMAQRLLTEAVADPDVDEEEQIMYEYDDDETAD